MSWLTDPFQYGFMLMALLAAIIVGVTCAALGVYVVLRGMAFAGEALSHTILPGLVIAYLNGWNLFGGALVAGVLTALGIGWFSRRQAVREDTAIGVMFAGMFALGILLMSRSRSFRDMTHLLFGDLLGVTEHELAVSVGVGAVLVLMLVLFHKELALTSFDPTHARVIGIPADGVRYALLILLALAVIVGVRVVGVVLISALLVTPAAAASLLTDRLPRMMLLAALIAAGSAIAGLYVSYYWDVASGAAIVLACTICFVAAWLVRAARASFTT